MEELGNYTGKRLSASDAETISNIACAIEKIEKLKMYEYGGYSSADDYSYRYTRDYDRDSSYRGRTRDSRGRYSMDDGREHMLEKLREMEMQTDDMKVKDALHKAMDMMR